MEVKKLFARSHHALHRREVVFAIYGAENATPEEIEKLGPQVGDVCEQSKLKVASRKVTPFTLGKGMRGHVSDELASFAGIVKPRRVPEKVVKALKKKAAQQLERFIGAKIPVDLRPTPRVPALLLRVSYEHPIIKKDRTPWVNRAARITNDERKLLNSLGVG